MPNEKYLKQKMEVSTLQSKILLLRESLNNVVHDLKTRAARAGKDLSDPAVQEAISRLTELRTFINEVSMYSTSGNSDPQVADDLVATAQSLVNLFPSNRGILSRLNALMEELQKS